MAEQRSPMKEFRLLDKKRAAEGLTPAEEARHAQLKELVGPELGAGAPRGGFDVDAAAAMLRDSLQPAGARNRPPPAPEPPAPLAPAAGLASTLEAELFGPGDDAGPEPDPFLGAALTEPFDPAAQPADEDASAAALFDAPEDDAAYAASAAVEGEAAWAPGEEAAQARDAGVAPYDASQPYDPGAAPYDPNQPYDPSAPPYDASQPYDPNAPPYDASQPYDPNAPPYDPNQPYDPNAPPYDPNQPYDPAAAPYDPNQPYDPAAAPYDPSQPYDPNAPPYDASQPYDPGAPPYDPSQPYDPGAAPYDPNQPYDPNAPVSAAEPYDPDAALQGEPAAWAGPEPFEPTSPDAAGPGGAPWDPGTLVDAAEPPEAGAADSPAFAEPVFGTEPWEATDAPGDGDPFAATQELFAPSTDAAVSPDPAPSFVSEAESLPPAGWDAEPEPAATAPVQPSALGEYDETGAVPAPADDAGLESMLPFDPAAAAALAPGDVPEGFAAETGEYDDTAAFERTFPEVAPPDLPNDGTGFQAAQAMAPEHPAPFGEEALDDPFELASGGSFDASAAAAAPDWAGAPPEPPWAQGEPGPTSADAPLAVEPLEVEAPAAQAAEVEAPEASDELEGLDASAAAAFTEETTEPSIPEVSAGLAVPETAAELASSPEAGLAETPGDASPPEQAAATDLEDFAIDVDVDIDVDAPADAAEPSRSAGAVEAPVDPADLAGSAALSAELPELPADPDADPSADLAPELPAALPGPEPVLDFSRPDFSEGDEGGGDPYPAPSAPPASAPPPSQPPARAASALPHLELEDAASPPEDIPTIEGEEILEEVADGAGAPPQPLDFAPPGEALDAPQPPPPAPAPPSLPPSAAIAPKVDPAPEPPPAISCHLPGVHRVVVHTVEGQVRRGLLEEPDLGAPNLALAPQPGAAAEDVPTDKVKAIFFMLAPGEQAPAATGKKVRVTFKDGRQVAGFSPDYAEDGPGFFMVPGDTRTNTGRIWVYRAAARAISVS